MLNILKETCTCSHILNVAAFSLHGTQSLPAFTSTRSLLFIRLLSTEGERESLWKQKKRRNSSQVNPLALFLVESFMTFWTSVAELLWLSAPTPSTDQPCLGKPNALAKSCHIHGPTYPGPHQIRYLVFILDMFQTLSSLMWPLRGTRDEEKKKTFQLLFVTRTGSSEWFNSHFLFQG